MKLVIIKYNGGNSTSLSYALNRLGYEVIITDDAQIILNADKIFFPGQGEASSAMAYLKEKGLDIILKNAKQPLLGICLGMQLFGNFSEEANTKCFGLLNINIKKIPPQFSVPHIGWNSLSKLQSPLFTSLQEGAFVYYANSFFIPLIKESIATTTYHEAFSAAIHFKNFYGIQFHPEKSGIVGEQILKNFIQLC